MNTSIIEVDITPLLNDVKRALQEIAAEKGRPMLLTSVLQAINFLTEFMGDQVPIPNCQIDPFVNEIGAKLRNHTLQFVRQKGSPQKKDIADFVSTLDTTIVIR